MGQVWHSEVDRPPFFAPFLLVVALGTGVVATAVVSFMVSAQPRREIPELRPTPFAEPTVEKVPNFAEETVRAPAESSVERPFFSHLNVGQQVLYLDGTIIVVRPDDRRAKLGVEGVLGTITRIGDDHIVLETTQSVGHDSRVLERIISKDAIREIQRDKE